MATDTKVASFKGTLLFTLTAGILVLLISSTGGSNVKITNNGYEGIVVAFSPRINQSVGEPLIDRIKELFKNASVALYNATRQRAYFKQVTILVPQEWERKDYETAGSEVFGEADIRIDDPNPEYSDGPYTLQPLGCGSEGLFIHLTPGYLRNLKTTSTKLFGDPGKTFVHEWAHLRYGIFDEFGYPGNPVFPMAYYDDEDLLPNSCTNGRLKGVWKDVVNDAACSFDEETGLPNDDCVFLPSLDENDDIKSSLASYHFLRKAFTFCDDGEEYYHNPIAPNKHNVLCESQSTWSVIQQHKDFSGDNNKARPGIKDLMPTFTIKQRMEATYCLVLDTSGSMGNLKPISVPLRKDILYAAVKRWLQEEVSLGSAVGIVPFAEDVIADQVVPVTKIITEEKRKQMITKIPNLANGGTGIGRGLRKAKELLQEYRHGPGGIIVLVTDGEETAKYKPTIQDVLTELKESQIRVVTIALHTSQGVKLQELAKATGGKLFSIPIGAGMERLGMAFYEALTYQASEFTLAQKIQAMNYSEDAISFLGKFAIDSTIGNDTTIDFTTIGGNNKIANVTISGPNTKDDIGKAAFKEPSKLPATFVRFKYASLQAGVYIYNITRNKKSSSAIQVSVTSKAKSANTQPIITRSWIQEEAKSTSEKPRFVILAEVKQGNNPVINAAVVAKVDRPNKESVTVQLFDNGNGAPDVTRNDGIYARYFTQFSGKGRYSVTAQVTDDGKAAISEIGFSGSRSMPITNKFQAHPNVTQTATGSFTRESSSGAFDITVDLKEDKVDLFPPSRVSDLQVVYISADNANVTLSWTAPGDDFDTGTVSSYDIRYSSNWTKLRHQFNDRERLNVLLNPLEAGSKEILNVLLPGLAPRATIYVALKAVDKNNQESSLSNIVDVTGVVNVPPTEPTTTVVTARITNHESTAGMTDAKHSTGTTIAESASGITNSESATGITNSEYATDINIAESSTTNDTESTSGTTYMETTTPSAGSISAANAFTVLYVTIFAVIAIRF